MKKETETLVRNTANIAARFALAIDGGLSPNLVNLFTKRAIKDFGEMTDELMSMILSEATSAVAELRRLADVER